MFCRALVTVEHCPLVRRFSVPADPDELVAAGLLGLCELAVFTGLTDDRVLATNTDDMPKSLEVVVSPLTLPFEALQLPTKDVTVID